MADQVRVFVSHHHSPDEDAFTAQLVADLEAAGAGVWVDVVGVGAADFQQRINQALATCVWLVLVLTPEAIASPWVEMEVHAAVRLKAQGQMRGIIQVMAKPVAQDKIPPTWGIYAHFDATRDYDAALNQTLREVGLSPLPPTLAAPQPAPPPPAIPSDRFPPRLADLGYEWHVIDGVELIMPPLCDVPAGSFLMGSNPRKDKATVYDERPQHRLRLADFKISKFPVTVAEYACFTRSTGHPAPNDALTHGSEVSWEIQLRERLDHPVVLVNSYDAGAYIEWLSERTFQPWLLPSAAQWEKTARGTDARIYPWGNAFDKAHANTAEGGKATTTPVGSYPSGASPYGVLDMAGNVWEWTSEPNRRYPYDAPILAVTIAETRELRGGSWDVYSDRARGACRLEHHATAVFHDIGFRLAR